MAIAEPERDREAPNPVAVGIGCVAALALASFGLARAVDSLGWTLYSLTTDLWLAAVYLWLGLFTWAGFASVSARVRRAGLPFGGLLGGPPCSRTLRRVWVALGLAAVGAALLPAVLRSSPQGLTVRAGQPWRSTGSSDPGIVVRRPTFGDTTPPWTPQPAVAVGGWVYAPVSGSYHFELTARGDALVEVDDTPFLGLGEHGAHISKQWATDPSGARRAAGDLAMGFHRITLNYRPGDGPAGLRLRWTPPHVAKPRSIAARFLLPDGTPPTTRQWRALALGSHRLGIAALAFLVAVPLSGLVARALARVWPSASGTRPSGRGVSRDEARRRA